jgi:hypothetical protein
MSERQINDPQSTPQAPASVDASAASALASARRRRFIKGGAGLIPVALTLNSRPVLATSSNGACFSASAWGSIQGLAATTSQYVRQSGRAQQVTCYTKAEWCGKASAWDSKNKKNRDKATCGGWMVTKISCADAWLDTVKTYTVAKACGGTASAGGLAGGASAWDCLTATASTDQAKAQQALLVAWLNCQISQTTRTDVCVIDTFNTNQLTILSNCVASGSAGAKGPDGKTWTATMVLNYLQKNFIGA